MDDPKDVRMIQTRDGVQRIPRTQEGMAMKDYLQNTELPADLERSIVYITKNGPVAAAPDPIPWSAEHDKEAQAYADKLKVQIEEKGYYANTLSSYAGRLADETGYPREEMKALIVSKFDETYGQEPYDHLQVVRAEKGLPVREPEATPDQGLEPEQ